MSDHEQTVVDPLDFRVVDVKPLDGFRIWIRFNDGAEGELDLTEYAEKPWFQPWQERRVFENVWIPLHGGDIRWGDDPEESDMGFCLTWLYTELTGRPWDEVLENAKIQLINA